MQFGIISTFTILFLVSLLMFRYDYKLNYKAMTSIEVPIEQVNFSLRNLIREELK